MNNGISPSEPYRYWTLLRFERAREDRPEGDARVGDQLVHCHQHDPHHHETPEEGSAGQQPLPGAVSAGKIDHLRPSDVKIVRQSERERAEREHRPVDRHAPRPRPTRWYSVDRVEAVLDRHHQTDRRVDENRHADPAQRGEIELLDRLEEVLDDPMAHRLPGAHVDLVQSEHVAEESLGPDGKLIDPAERAQEHRPHDDDRDQPEERPEGERAGHLGRVVLTQLPGAETTEVVREADGPLPAGQLALRLGDDMPQPIHHGSELLFEGHQSSL
jgi:hypothetical protein